MTAKSKIERLAEARAARSPAKVPAERGKPTAKPPASRHLQPKPEPPPKTAKDMTIVELLKADIAKLPPVPKLKMKSVTLRVPKLPRVPTAVHSFWGRWLNKIRNPKLREIVTQMVDQPPHFAWGFVTGACMAASSGIWATALLYGWWHGREAQQGTSQRWYDPPLDHMVFHVGIAYGWLNRDAALAWALSQWAELAQRFAS